jgi:hypothetical protein
LSQAIIKGYQGRSPWLVRERIRTRRAGLREEPGVSAETENVIEEILVSKEVARIDLGIELLIAQPAASEDSANGA